MKAKPIFIAVAAMFSAAAIAGGDASNKGASQGASSEQHSQQSSQQSSQNPEIVKQAQEKLSAAGHEVQPDGKMGPKTQAALKEWQQKEGLQASGQLDTQTLAALEIGTPEGTTTGSSAGSSSAGTASGGSSSAGSSSERTAEPAAAPSEPSKSEPSKPQ